MTTLARSLSSLCDIYSALIGHSKIANRCYSKVFFASRHWYYRTLNCAATTLTHLQQVHSLEYHQRFSLKFARGDRAFSELGPTGSSGDEDMDPYFEASYAKLGTSSCKKCKEKIEKGALRLAKVRCANNILVVVLIAHDLQ